VSTGFLSPRQPWQGRRVVLGVTGSIAAYKAIAIARSLTSLGAAVDTVLTDGARQFVSAISFEGVTGRDSATELFSVDKSALHISLGVEADVVCVAPATADFIARSSQGRANDLLSTTLLATKAPIVICPAMNTNMYTHPQTQRNLKYLSENLSYTVAGPAKGALAYGESEGMGRMLEPDEIIEEIGKALVGSSPLKDKVVLVTAGPTQESIDPVRFISNRSSGRMGFSIAQAAHRLGASVRLVTGPVALPDPYGVDTIRVNSAHEMLASVSEWLPQVDVSIFGAAVSDYGFEKIATNKMKRSEKKGPFILDLVENPDIALETKNERKAKSITVGFALETESLLGNARDKLERKQFDFIVANRADEEDAGFDSENNRVTLLFPDGRCEEVPLMSKHLVSEIIMGHILELLKDRP
tara:strand:- start:125431 stop:126672 length:1242 start_codon:yes stop_codon:yes gene_type:complete